jgi:5-methylcytosine-specific restriction endonuclease McrA
MSADRPPPKEFRASSVKAKPTYAEKLADVRWKRKRDEMLRRSNYTCCECGAPLVSGTMDLQVHHVVYISCLEPWDYPDELLLVVCDWHHRERQAVEQAIFVEVGKHLATLDVSEMRRQPIYAFFEEDSTLNYLPLHMRELLRYERDHD